MLSKEKIEQIRNDAEDYATKFFDSEKQIVELGYKKGATAEAEKALCLIEALEKIQNGPSDRLSHSIAHTALESYTEK